MANNADLQDGDWIQPAWTGHAYYGQTGQVIGTSNSGANWLIDVDGDGSTDYFLSKVGSHYSGSMSHAGMMSDNFNGIATKASNLFDIVVPITFAVIGIGIMCHFVKKVKRS